MSKIYGARKAKDAAQLTKAIDTEMNRYGISYDDIITEMKQDPLVKWLQIAARFELEADIFS